MFEGKSPAERNKIIAALVIGALAIISLAYTFGPSLIGTSGSARRTTTEPERTPTPASAVPSRREITRLPAQDAIDSVYSSIPVQYFGSGAFSVPVTGRNIFAFWEPGDPTPVPIDTTTPTPIPVPTEVQYAVFLSFVTPQSVYAGSNSFRLEANGDKFRPDSRIVFNGSPLATRFISEQRLTANVPANLISSAFTGGLMVETPGTEFFSRSISFTVQEPPKPEFEYIGMLGRQHYNNDTAYFQEKGARSGDPFSGRLNDIIKGRFRVISISEKEVVFEDTRLGFKHRLPLLRPKPGVATGNSGSGYGDGTTRNGTRVIPGIPSNIPRATPRRRNTTRVNPTRPTPRPDQKQEESDDNDEDN